MLVETTFRIGGIVCLTAGALMLAVFLHDQLPVAYFEVYLSPAMFFVLGMIFLYVSVEAARDRQELLRLGTGTGLPTTDPDPARGPHR